MREPIQHRSRHLGVGEDLGPVGEGEIGGDDDRGVLVDTISGYIEGLLDGVEFKRTSYALDRGARKATLARFLKKMSSARDDGLIRGDLRCARLDRTAQVRPHASNSGSSRSLRVI